jgi:hypothetical protein
MGSAAGRIVEQARVDVAASGAYRRVPSTQACWPDGKTTVNHVEFREPLFPHPQKTEGFSRFQNNARVRGQLQGLLHSC